MGEEDAQDPNKFIWAVDLSTQTDCTTPALIDLCVIELHLGVPQSSNLTAVYSVLGLGRYGVHWANQHPSNGYSPGAKTQHSKQQSHSPKQTVQIFSLSTRESKLRPGTCCLCTKYSFNAGSLPGGEVAGNTQSDQLIPATIDSQAEAVTPIPAKIVCMG